MDREKFIWEHITMNVLILGKADSVFTRDFCTNVLNPKEINTVILSQAFPKEYEKDYENAGVRIVQWPECFLKGIKKQIKEIFFLHKKMQDLEKEIGFGEKIDVLHVHYVEPLHLFYFLSFWKKANKRILTFWGSDLYTASKNKLLLFKYFLKKSSFIVLMINNQYDDFRNKFGNKYNDKIKIIDFGNSLLNKLDIVNQTAKEECKRYFNFPLKKIVVHIGYNASKAQQHIEVLNSIKNLQSSILSKMTFVFFVSYRKSNDFDIYKRQMIEIMDKAHMEYVFCDRYLQGEELAMFRRTCDIFIYGQKTDARSESPIEYVYAGAEFICPKWLESNYELLKQGGINFYTYDNFESLNDSVLLCLENIDLKENKISEQGRQRIRDEISWDSLAEKWRSLYE